MRIVPIAVALVLVLDLAPARACLQELATYGEREGVARMEMRPAEPQAAMHAIEFRISVKSIPALLDGYIMWTVEAARPYGMVFHDCPEGDVTGDELRACTVWQGAIYAIGQDGSSSVMPKRGEKAARALLLPDFGPALHHFAGFGDTRPDGEAWDQFDMDGCQE